MLKVKKNPTVCEVGQVWKCSDPVGEVHFVFIYGPNRTLVGVQVEVPLSRRLFLANTNRYTEKKVGAPACSSWEFVGMVAHDT